MTSAASTVNLQRGEFTNEPFTDFTRPDIRKKMEEALASVHGQFGREYPLTIGGENVTTTAKIQSTDRKSVV